MLTSHLIQAANEGKVEFVKWLIENGANINWTMGSGWTALHAASMNGKNEVCMHILHHSIQFNSILIQCH